MSWPFDRRGSRNEVLQRDPFGRELSTGARRPQREQLVTDKVKSYGAARRSIIPSVDRNTARYGVHEQDMKSNRS